MIGDGASGGTKPIVLGVALPILGLLLVVGSALVAISSWPKHTSAMLSLLGYLSAPLLVVICLSVMMQRDLKLQQNPWYDRGPRSANRLKAMKAFTIIAFAVGSAHAWKLAELWSRQP